MGCRLAGLIAFDSAQLTIAQFFSKYTIDNYTTEVLSKMRFHLGEQLDEETAKKTRLV